ncbi:MAG: hypothetical protein U5L06_06620 [Rhodovibrio sp.]|nr:hypothetical protein [Rhodovibrio sp.]
MPIVYASGLVGILTFSANALRVAFSSATLTSIPIAASVNLFGAIFLIGFCTIDRTAIRSVIRDYHTNFNTQAQRGEYNGSLTINLGLAVGFRSLAHACLFLSLSEGERVFAVILYELYPFILLMLSSFANKDEMVKRDPNYPNT